MNFKITKSKWRIPRKNRIFLNEHFFRLNAQNVYSILGRRVARFFLVQYTKEGKNKTNDFKITKCPSNIGTQRSK
jgi:hypothetical protein